MERGCMNTQKKAYRAPQLTRLGKLTELTTQAYGPIRIVLL